MSASRFLEYLLHPFKSVNIEAIPPKCHIAIETMYEDLCILSLGLTWVDRYFLRHSNIDGKAIVQNLKPRGHLEPAGLQWFTP